MTLTEFLEARIAEDEATLPADSGKRSTSQAWWSTDFDVVFIEEDRFRAECAAKRAILVIHALATEDYAGRWWTDPAPPGTYSRTGCVSCTICGVDGEETIDDGPCPTLLALAQPYADHPDFDEAWRP